LLPWLLRCPGCALEVSRLGEARYNGTALVGWDRRTELAMAAVREAAADALLDALAARGLLRPGRLLDVGCGPGWFVRVSAARGLEAVGIEPDAAVAERARAAGLDVRTGAFPDVSLPGPIDYLCFNDVFEHLPDPARALEAAQAQLAPGGLLVLNLPSSRGAVYRVARLLARAGIAAPLARMWQQGFESPHLYYYAPANLRRLVTRHGFDMIDEFAIGTLSRRGLWGRIRVSRGVGPAAAAAVYAATLLAMPLLRLLPADGLVQVHRRR
jgi:SAM-dependent methyltransferase